MAQNNTKMIATEASRMLDSVSIPNVHYGWLAMNFAGVETNSLEVELVVEDNQVQAATAVFQNFGQCTNSNCNELLVRRRNVESPPRLHYHSVPAAHYHMGDGQYLLSFFTKSAILWWLPDFQLGAPAANDPYLTLSTNPSLPLPAVTGEWRNLHPVKILKPGAFLDATILLFCRNACHHERLGALYSYMIAAMSDSEPGAVKKTPRAEFQPAWDCFNGRCPAGTDPISEMKKLRQHLIERGELGILPPERGDEPSQPDPLSEMKKIRQRLIERGELGVWPPERGDGTSQ
ncbi:hypothetical protein BJY00DRAFT_64852 [Aspergillus carlsbadensis]|nr:hypothetical protein BJY00DRAFT_64852 [Aspergillus carlsbadensis]